MRSVPGRSGSTSSTSWHCAHFVVRRSQTHDGGLPGARTASDQSALHDLLEPHRRRDDLVLHESVGQTLLTADGRTRWIAFLGLVEEPGERITLCFFIHNFGSYSCIKVGTRDYWDSSATVSISAAGSAIA